MTYKLSHRRINQALAVTVIILGVYLVFVPLIPKASQKLKAAPDASQILANPPAQNRVIIKSAKINTAIVEGSDISVIDNGNVWRRPATSSDPRVSNMVIVGHNFTYRDPTPPFYSLGEVKENDTINLWWQGQLYSYKVISNQIVLPTAVEVEEPTPKPTLTLYTCYPLFIANQRQVIQAELEL